MFLWRICITVVIFPRTAENLIFKTLSTFVPILTAEERGLTAPVCSLAWNSVIVPSLKCCTIYKMQVPRARNFCTELFPTLWKHFWIHTYDCSSKELVSNWIRVKCPSEIALHTKQTSHLLSILGTTAYVSKIFDFSCSGGVCVSPSSVFRQWGFS